MKILGIDTTTKFLCLGIYDGSNIYEYNLELATKHSALLIPTIERLLKALAWSISDIDYFACGLGPGSFTGIRVGLGTIKAFSWSLKKPIVGISSLDILARNAVAVGSCVVPAIDARRNLIYCSIYNTKNGALRKIAPYMLLTEEEFLRQVPRNAVVLGDGLSLCKENISRRIKGVKILDRDCWNLQGRNIIELALEKIESAECSYSRSFSSASRSSASQRRYIRDKKLNDAFNIEPIYLYPKECQIRISHMANRISS